MWGSRLILAYHGIIPDGESDAFRAERALFVSQARFGAQLDVLLDVANVAPLEAIDEEGDGRPRVAITFDDAYAGAVTSGVAELARRGLPATIFVAPGCLDRHVFWWDAFADASGALDPAFREYALTNLAGDDSRVRFWAATSLQVTPTEAVPSFARSATVDELARALQTPGITLGSHTWSHPALPGLEKPELATELARPREWLRERFGERAIDWLAYPYGHSSLAVVEATRAAGYEAALAITGGWHRFDPALQFARPRLTIGAGMSANGFRARVLGSLPT